ncbi:MAG: hypothetical protein M0P40_00490 [Bacteroidales bacterium]|jgi:hypothetical protein|nr:hypothetical protein [Bacteroidales bacterium]MDD2263474.1 hypothetical protein [Bacteroidales bacterium]MDD3207935.1 hypothetical protein [Bacteroidales bacterium]MDD3696558.1 hypothetical protein [Bacteroidales bacterium]MDD4167324.1 hypothetical protein [Bacteroidales bacterium]
MKKFLKWSAAFLVLGVLAVGCIKNEPSPGIEAMRNAKAALLTAQASLVQAKVQVEAANAALIQAQASYIKAQEAVVAAQAKRIEAEAALIQAQVEWEKALTDFHKEAWAKEIEKMEIELEIYRAEADAAIAAYQLVIAQMQAQMVQAMQAYEAALLAFEQWKIANAATLAQDLLNALDAILFQIKGVILDLAEAQIELNYAKTAYEWYVNVTYPEDVEHALLHMQRDKMRLECQIEYLTGVVEAYEALYNAYHGEFDELIAGFQDVITALRAEIAEMEIDFIKLQEKWLLFDHQALDNANAALTKNRKVSIANVFSDKGDDPNIHVVNGTYSITAPWTGANSMFNMMKRDMRVIEDTRAEFEDQDSGVIKRNLEAKQKQANDATTKYKTNWNNWQKYYDEARISGSHVGSRYTAWVNAWTAWDTQMANYRVHLNTYDDMYFAADSLISLFMEYLDGWLDEGTLTVPGSANISEVLGGIKFNAGTLANFIFQGNAGAVINALNTIIGLINAPTQMDAIITQLKGLMDGTHPEGYPPFWEHATAWTYKPTPVVYGDIMRAVYANSNKKITELTKQDWYVWLFLYWLFEDRQVEIGLENPHGGTVITINAADYKDAAEQVLFDFFGKLDRAAYQAYMVGVSTKPIENAIKAYYNAVEGLGAMETAMFDPFDREWKAKKYVYDSKGKVIDIVDWSRTQALAAVTEKPAIKEIYATPSKYDPPVYDDDKDWDETQPRPVDATQFFFVLEGPDGMGRTTISPSLDFDITYLNKKCDLYVSYAALLNAGEYCGEQWSEWAGDLPLWLWSERNNYGEGHYFYAIWQTRDYQAYLDTYNRVKNGEYAALIDKIQALYDAQLALYTEAKALRDALQAELDDIVEELLAIGGYYDPVKGEWVMGNIEIYELWIEEYQWLIQQAMWAHNGGNIANEGLLEAWSRAKHDLMEKQNELRRIEEAIALYEQGLPMPSFMGLIENEAARYQAQIDIWLEEIQSLQQKLVILEGIRAKLLENYQ